MSTEEASLKVVIDSLIPILQKHDGREYLAVAQLLRERLCRPHAFVTVCGETSTGKSSLINGLFRKPLLPVAASPTTATVTHVILREDETDSFYSIGRNATLNEIDSQRFIDLSRTPDKDLLRLQVREDVEHRLPQCAVAVEVGDLRQIPDPQVARAMHGPAVRLADAGDDVQQRALAASVHTDEGDTVAGIDFERNPREDFLGSEILAQVGR